MFVINSNILQNYVKRLQKGASKSRLAEKALFITTDATEQTATFFFTGDDVTVEIKLVAEQVQAMATATSLNEFKGKVAVLPTDEMITVALESNQLKLKWGKNSEVMCEVLGETSPNLAIPETVQQVTWTAGVLHGIAYSMPSFCATPNSSIAKSRPSVMGPNFEADDTGEVIVRATDSFKVVKVRAEKMQWFADFPCSIDAQTLATLAEILPKECDVVIGMNAAKTALVFRSGNITALSRLLIGEFPQIDGVFKEAGTSTWTFDRLELLEICRRVKALKPVSPTVEFRCDGNKVFAHVPRALNQQVSVAIDGAKFNFTVNAYYVELVASLFHGKDDIEFIMQGAQQPITIQNRESADIRAVVLPIVTR